MSSLPPGARIGAYEILEEIGHGAMGSVHKAYDAKLRRTVAIKTIRDDRCDAAFLERFQREAVALARLHHSGIVTLYEAGSHGGIPFVAMELVEGKSLEERLRKGPLSPQESARIVEAVAAAVFHAHGQGVIHRDLKPGNILLDSALNPRIVDFGLARVETDRLALTRSGDVLGTPAYMAPEQARGLRSRINAKTDIYALGVLLYQMLSGKLPFEGRTAAEVYEGILRRDPTPPSRIRTVPRDLEVICLKAMAKEQERRYATAGEVAEDLRRFQEGEPIQARPPSVWYRWRKRIVRGKALIAIATGAAAVIAAILLVGIPRLRAARTGATQEQHAADRAREQAQRYRWLEEEKIKPLTTMISEIRSGLYLSDGDRFRSRVAEMERTVEELEELSKDSVYAANPDVWVLVGIGRYFLGEDFRAEKALLRAEGEEQARSYLARIDLERALMILTEDAPLSMKIRRERAEGIIEKAIERLKDSKGEWIREIDRHLAQAYLVLARGESAKVLELVREGLERYGTEPGREDYYLLSACTKAHEWALEDLTRALAIRPQHALAHLLMADKFRVIGDRDRSLASWSRAIEISPRFYRAFCGRGFVRMERKDRAGTIDDFARALEVAPPDWHRRAEVESLLTELQRRE